MPHQTPTAPSQVWKFTAPGQLFHLQQAFDGASRQTWRKCFDQWGSSMTQKKPQFKVHTTCHQANPLRIKQARNYFEQMGRKITISFFFWCHMLYRQRQMRWVLVYTCIRAKPLLSGFKRTVSIIVSDNFLMGKCPDCAAERFLNGHKAKEDIHSLSVTEGSLTYLCAEWTIPKHYPLEHWDVWQNRPRIFIAACI